MAGGFGSPSLLSFPFLVSVSLFGVLGVCPSLHRAQEARFNGQHKHPTQTLDTKNHRHRHRQIKQTAGKLSSVGISVNDKRGQRNWHLEVLRHFPINMQICDARCNECLEV